MDQSEFGQFVAALWERQGWQTQVKRDDGRLFVAVQRPQTGEEGLLWAVGGDAEISGQQVQQFVKLCQQYEVGESAIVTAGSVSDHARKVSKGSAIELLDGDQLADLLRRKELTDLAEQYGGGADADDGGDGDGDGSPLDGLRALGERATGLAPVSPGDISVSGKPALAVVAVVAVVGLLAMGVISAPSLPFVGGGGAGPISAESAAPANATTTLHVEWNAKTVATIDPDRSDDRAYRAPRGEQFVLVRMQINNTGNGTAPLKRSAFRLRTDERTYSHQPLADHQGFVDFNISSGQRYVGWTVFSVPEGSTGTLVYDQNETGAPVAVEFERNPGISLNVTQL